MNSPEKHLGFQLLIETATEDCSVALISEGTLLSELVSDEKMKHTSELTLLIEKIIYSEGYKIEELNAVAVGLGPGSYTGLRTGLTTAKSLCYGLDVPLYGISSLEGLASHARVISPRLSEDVVIIPVIDARRMEVYYSVWDIKGECLKEANTLIIDENSIQELFLQFPNILFCGNGCPKIEPFISKTPTIQVLDLPCLARNLHHPALKAIEAGKKADLAYLEPLYIKPPNITRSRKTLF